MDIADSGQIGWWFDACSDALVLYARQWLECASAEDVVQEVYLRLARQRRMPENPKAWLFRAVRNTAISELRAQSRRRKYEKTRATRTSPWFVSPLADRLDAQTAELALTELGQQQREVVVLKIWAQMTLQEISETLGAPISTIHSRYVSAIKLLQKRMSVTCKNKNH
jgi:RNA polymerase sigma-70 factor (ECF subfamily)